MSKNSFVLYKDQWEIIGQLNTNQRGQFLEVIFKYVRGEELPEMENEVRLVFTMIKAQLLRDKHKWENEVEKRREAGHLGGIKSGEARSKSKQNEANKASASQPKTKGHSYKQEATEVLDWLNHVTGKNYRAVDSNLELIANRLKSGVTVQQCKAVIAIKNRAWKDDPKMSQFLRPETLFGKTKFESYIAEVGNVEEGTN